MKTRHLFAALAATCLALLQGCDTSASVASTARDRSSEGSGQVAFRLSQKALNTLGGNGNQFRIDVSGPGIKTMTFFQNIDTMAYVSGIPCGTRYVKVSVINNTYDTLAYPTWTGIDTVEVDPGAYAWAHIVLRKATAPTGSVYIDLTLDSTWNDSIRPPRDTIYPETLWVDTLVPPKYPNVPKCRNIWSTGGSTYHYRCLLPVYRDSIPHWFGNDTVWYDSTVTYPVDTSWSCYFSYSNDSANHYTCTRLVYRPASDTTWSDTITSNPSDSSTYCYSTSISTVHCIRPIHPIIPVHPVHPMVDTTILVTKPKKTR